MPIVLSPSALAAPAGSPTLADLERELARRTGPHRVWTADAGGTTSLVPVAAVRSSVEQGGWSDLWLLRRGLMATGEAVTGFDPADRQRLIKSHDADDGLLEVDRPYATAVAAGEAVEVCLLEPDQELRVAVRRGLDRCYAEDRVPLALTTFSAERDLTAARAWLTKPQQLRGVRSLAAGGTWAPVPVGWWDWFLAGGHLSAAISPDPSPDTAYLSVYRPVSSWVNGADSTTGPTQDGDVLVVDLEYAVVAAHNYAWEAFPDRLGPSVGTWAGGHRPSKGEVQTAWKVQMRKWVKPPPDRIQLSYPPAWGSTWETAS